MNRDFAVDLRSAQASRVCVDLRTSDGHAFFTGVAEVDPQGRWVSIFEPRTLGDTTSRREIPIGDIVSLTVTRVGY